MEKKKNLAVWWFIEFMESKRIRLHGTIEKLMTSST